MNNFLSVTKKMLKEILLPYGYKNCKSTFYKMENDLCFLIQAKKTAYSRPPNIHFEVYIDFVPYCTDLKKEDYELTEGRNRIIDFRWLLTPNKSQEEILEYFFKRTMGGTTIERLNYIRDDMENMILPHINKFTDLEFFYCELKKLMEAFNLKKEDIYRSSIFYALAVKLHKYEDAIIGVDSQVAIYKNNMEKAKLQADNILTGNIDSYMLDAQKRKPDITEITLRSAGCAVVDYTEKIKNMQIMREALLAKDNEFLDRYTSEKEIYSREYFKKMLIGG